MYTLNSQVPAHLEHILFEVLKNAIRATVENYNAGAYLKNAGDHVLKDNGMPAIKLIVSKGDYDVSIKISDEGGGIKRRTMPRIWSYQYSTAPYVVPPSSCAVTGSSAMLDAAGYAEEDIEFITFRQNFFGGGFGLPIARVFARYFGGELKVFSVEGFGTDAFVYIPHLGHSKEVKP